jgi:hypothetical protein
MRKRQRKKNAKKLNQYLLSQLRTAIKRISEVFIKECYEYVREIQRKDEARRRLENGIDNHE